MYYVYVLHSETDQGLYIGFSSNLRRRLAEHNAGIAPATAYRGPWKLIYYEAYVTELDARGREEFLKSGAGRAFFAEAVPALLRLASAANRVSGLIHAAQCHSGVSGDRVGEALYAIRM